MICQTKKIVKTDGIIIPKETRGKVVGIQFREDKTESLVVLFDGQKEPVNVEKSEIVFI
jgi:hypothetical protein